MGGRVGVTGGRGGALKRMKGGGSHVLLQTTLFVETYQIKGLARIRESVTARAQSRELKCSTLSAGGRRAGPLRSLNGLFGRGKGGGGGRRAMPHARRPARHEPAKGPSLPACCPSGRSSSQTVQRTARGQPGPLARLASQPQGCAASKQEAGRGGHQGVTGWPPSGPAPLLTPAAARSSPAPPHGPRTRSCAPTGREAGPDGGGQSGNGWEGGWEGSQALVAVGTCSW